MKKHTIYSELVYVAAILLLTLAVAMTAAADLGVSMVVAPAYILHLKFDAIHLGSLTIPLTFGVFTYLVEGLIFIVFCILMKKVKLSYFCSFLTCVIYGYVLDAWRAVVPLFNESITPPGSMALWARILLFAGGMVLTSFSVALFFKTYIPPQVIDFFVKGVSEKYSIDRTKFKIITDAVLLITACAMTLLFFGKFKGIGVGTVIITLCNGWLIGLFTKLLDKFFSVKAIFPKIEAKFSL
ncbi:MAG: hypothetical protein IJR55_04645 [Clostridia bacterium]|nr:hypothetical protein [Clostridia bacterium]